MDNEYIEKDYTSEDCERQEDSIVFLVDYPNGAIGKSLDLVELPSGDINVDVNYLYTD